MTGNYSILLTGLNARDQNLAADYFSESGHHVIVASGILEAEALLKAQEIDLLYLQASGNNSAIDDLKEIAADYPTLPIVLLCRQPAGDFVLKAWHEGIADVLILPLTPELLGTSFQRATRHPQSRENWQISPYRARLFFIDETGKECWERIIPPRFTIGRSSSNNLVLAQSGISRNHAEVFFRNGECLLHDLGSKLGTYLNGVRVEESKLSNGDRIQLGGPQGFSLLFNEVDLFQSLVETSDSWSEIRLPVGGIKEVGMLLAALRALSSVPVVDDVLAMVVDTAIDLTEAERGFIMLKEEEGDLSFRCARNNHKRPLDGTSFQISQRIPRDVFRTGRSFVIRHLDLNNESVTHSSMRRLGLRSIACVPLRCLTINDSGSISGVTPAETIGVLYVDSSVAGIALSKMQIDALETLASEAAMAINNAQLYKLSRDKFRMDEQLDLARKIQEALLAPPEKTLPFAQVCSLNIPCHEIGGDYYDYFDLGDGRFGFAVGDVAGKGVPAALLATLTQGVVSALMSFDTPLTSMISKVNRTLARRGTDNRFVTFFLGILDADGTCTYVNAGHNPPYLIGRDGSMRKLTEGGMVLGLFPEIEYQAETIRLQPGDHLALFTDGVIEAANAEKEQFGIEQLEKILKGNAHSTASETLIGLREAVLSFSANAPQHDDITMMILGFRESQVQHPD